MTITATCYTVGGTQGLACATCMPCILRPLLCYQVNVCLDMPCFLDKPVDIPSHMPLTYVYLLSGTNLTTPALLSSVLMWWSILHPFILQRNFFFNNVGLQKRWKDITNISYVPFAPLSNVKVLHNYLTFVKIIKWTSKRYLLSTTPYFHRCYINPSFWYGVQSESSHLSWVVMSP